MKRILAISILFFYTLAISGAVVKMHYCEGKLASWNISSVKPVSCCCESTTSEKEHGNHASPEDCCSDKTIALELPQKQDYHQSFQNLFQLFFTDFISSGDHNYKIYSYELIEEKNFQNLKTKVGILQGIPLYKFHSSFIYYG